MAAGKKKQEDKDTDTMVSKRLLRNGAEELLARVPKPSPDLVGQTPEQLIHELEVHQIELETQAKELMRSQLALEESRDKYLSLYEFAPLGYLTLTDTALIEEVNLFGATLLGTDRKKLLNARFRKFIAQKDSEIWVRYFMDVLDQGEKQVCTLLLKRGDDSVFPSRLEGVRDSGSDGTTTVRIAFSDISDIWQIHALKERLKELNCLYGITALLELPGISLDETLKRTVLLLPPAWQYPEITEACIILEGSVFQTAHFRETSWMQAREIIVNGNPAGRVVVCYLEERQAIDEGPFLKEERNLLNTIAERLGHIIEHNRAEVALRQSETQLRGTLESTADGILAVDNNGKILHANRRFAELWQIPPPLIELGNDQVLLDFVVAQLKDPGAFLSKVQSLYGSDTVDMETLTFKDGRVMERYSTPMIRDGSYIGRVWSFRDITEHRRADEAVHEAQMRTQTILEGIADTFYSLDDEWRFSIINPAAEKAPFRRPASELIGRVIWEIYPGLAGTRIHQHYLDAAKNHSLEHYDSQSPLDGRWYEVFMQGRTGGVYVYMRDITERKQAEKALQESEERYRTLFEQNSDSIFVADPKTRMIIDNNRKAEQLTGYSRAELLFMRIDALHPEDVRRVTMDNFIKIKEGMDSNVDSILSTRDGKRVPVLITGGPVVVNGQTLLLGSFRDMTRQKHAEDTLRRVNQKLNVLSHLTRTELTSQIFLLDGYFGMAKSYAAGQDRIIETLQKGEKAIRLLRGTIAYSNDYQDMGAKPPAWQNVKRTMLFGLSHLPISEIQHSLETENLEVLADPLLEKACQHLFENSLAHGGHVTRVRVWHTVTPEGVNLVFEDDGIGIPTEKKDQIFLHDEDTRTSMRGLFFIKEILDISGITIRETGEPGKGARFEMAVPNGMWRLTGNCT
jgi:PAS domain S-box-containing protein